MIHGHGGNIYALAAQLGCRPEAIIDMSSNINPLGMMPGLLDHLKLHLDLAGKLPEVDGRTMIADLARLLEIEPQRLLAGNGTTQFIYQACPALDIRRAVIVGPTYADYADACRMHGIAPEYFLLDPAQGFEVDLEKLDRAVAGADLVFICNPNNPTGGLINADGLYRLCKNHPGTYFIIDESYLSFAPAEQSQGLGRCGLDNVIVLWSASKIFGMPGLRAGFLIGSGQVVRRFAHYAQPWCVNSLAQAAIGYLGRQKDAVSDFIQRTANFLVRERKVFKARLQDFETITIFTSVTSYLLIQLPPTIAAEALCDALARERLLIRNCGNFHGLSDHFVRIALKTAPVNQAAASHLADVLAGRSRGEAMPGFGFSMVSMPWWVIPLAFGLDALAGDPRGLPHPIRWMGWAIECCEPYFRKQWRSELLAGTFFALFLIAAAFGLCTLLISAAYALHPLAGGCLEVVLIFYCLSARSLVQAAMEIFGLLRRDLVDEARAKVAMIVGRDVSRYQGPDIARATVETVAENFVDGVLAPLFFAVLGGAPLAVAYKMVNTLDSMVGYRNQRYALFGSAAARIDDVANFIPARLSIVCIALAAQFLGGGTGGRSLGTALRQGRQHSSPNAGYPEAAFAGALGVRLNGPNIYHGVRVEKPYIGVEFGSARTGHIRKACELMALSAWICCIAFWLAALALR